MARAGSWGGGEGGERHGPTSPLRRQQDTANQRNVRGEQKGPALLWRGQGAGRGARARAGQGGEGARAAGRGRAGARAVQLEGRRERAGPRGQRSVRDPAVAQDLWGEA